MIISIGYRVNSYRGVQFRIWATQVLKEYLVKGFALNDDLLKRAGSGNYFDDSTHGHTAAEIIYNRANAKKDFMGLTTWTGVLPKRNDAELCKKLFDRRGA